MQLKIMIGKPDRIVNEKGGHVGTVIKRGFMKMEIYCFLCNKIVSSLKHYEKEH